MGVAFYRGADCCALCYDVNDDKTFESLNNWRDEFLVQASPKNPDSFPFVVLGNKIDMFEGATDSVEKKAQQWCAEHFNIPFFTTSAKNATNVDAAFQSIAKAAIAQKGNDADIFTMNNSVAIDQPAPEDKEQQKCC